MFTPVAMAGSNAEFWDLHRRLGDWFELRNGTSMSHRESHHEGRIDSRPEGLWPPLPPGSPTSMVGGQASHRSIVPDAPRPSRTLPSTLAQELEGSRKSKEFQSPVLTGSKELERVSAPLPAFTHTEDENDSQMCLPLHVRACWAEKAKPKGGRRASITIPTLETKLESEGFQLTLSPNGNFRNFWDLLGILLLGMDAVIIPLQFVQPMLFALYPYLSSISAVAIVYWSLDLCLAFFTGYLYKGGLVQDQRKIACHYLRTWFLPDLVVNCTDITLMLMEDDSIRASTRVLRLLRLLRVIRLGKVTRFASFLRDHFESEVAYTQFTVLLLVLGMMLLEHVIACGWFGISSLHDSGTWLVVFELTDKSFNEQYTSSLRWAFSQLGYGGTNIEAVNREEGMYSVAVALVSLMTSSTIISSMTSLVSSVQNQRMEATKQFALVRRFVRANHIPRNLCDRVTRFLHYTYHERISMPDDPPILELLSKSLRAELELCRYTKYLTKMPFLAQVLRNPLMSVQEGDGMKRLARSALGFYGLGEDDMVFVHGNEATMCFLEIQGALVYSQAESSARPHGWICEMCLWTPWTYMGDLRCLAFTKLYTLHAQTFCDVISSAAPLQNQAHVYARDYVRALEAQVLLNDLWHYRETEDPLHTGNGMEAFPWNLLKRPWRPLKKITPQ